ENNSLLAKVLDEIKKENKFANICFCIPRLKNPERLKFSIEKCVELGVTNFILFNSERTISKFSKIERWKKIALSAIKQSLHAYLPQIKIVSSLDEISELTGEKILLDQNAKHKFIFSNRRDKNYYFIFGPEGGLSEKEINLFEEAKIFSLGEYRLRSETAIIKCASLLK
ncbi:MAG: RsmE family RNA methyltransferase, partial [Ignavibacteriaceae bacterium]